MKKGLKITLGAGIVALAFAAFAVKNESDYAIDSHAKRLKKHSRNTLPDFSKKTELVYIKNMDGMTLCGHYLKADKPSRIVLAVHGWRSTWEHDFYDQCPMLQKLGCDVLYVDQRAHGQSEGRYIGFGVLERFDCLSWLDYIERNNKEGLPVYLFGVSMGATTVTLASELIGSGRVSGIIADCGFTSAKDIWHHKISQKTNKGADKLYFLYNMRCRRLAGYGGETRSTMQALSNTDIPFLFFHGEDDTFVPTEMSRVNYRACVSQKRLVTVQGAWHGKSCHVNPELYRDELMNFFDSNDKTNNKGV